jgi:hypothetical protein
VPLEHKLYPVKWAIRTSKVCALSLVQGPDSHQSQCDLAPPHTTWRHVAQAAAGGGGGAAAVAAQVGVLREIKAAGEAGLAAWSVAKLAALTALQVCVCKLLCVCVCVCVCVVREREREWS